ncbi:uncharacterized protein LOC143369924 [Andrena cerasifolii]|uniref:uncharacterized protein LOC143369924 n=1 Tax=Andrena cerasifolii TaxID=2819439 RepID=UPI00403826D3
MYRCQKLLDPVVICPYDEKHLIFKSRLQKHIVKCEKKYPEHYKVMCPYNATHRLFKSQLEEHIITCPTRNVLESEMYSEPRKRGATNFALQSEVSSVIDYNENWDLEANDDLKIFSDNESVSENNADTQKETVDSIARNKFAENGDLRAPRGFSEAMLREVNDESGVEDVESVVSTMAIGRGKVVQEKDKLRLIGVGRGRKLNTIQ